MTRRWRCVLPAIAIVAAGVLAACAALGGGPATASAAAPGSATGSSPMHNSGRPPGPDCSRTSVGLTPLTVLRTGRYDGYEGGLYPGGRNVPSRQYLKVGLAAAKQVRPLAPNGSPSRSGRIVVLSIGMSNTYLEFGSLLRLAASHDVRSGNLLVGGTLTRDPRVELVNGATPQWAAATIVNNESSYLAILNADLAAARVTADQVQAVWLDEALQNPNQPFPAYAQQLRGYLTQIVGMLTAHFPHLRLIYMSSREYAGYATSTTNPEPYAYQSGFAVKWALARKIAHHPRLRPWVAWGPYTWADGTIPRPDGLTWSCSDFELDGTHPSAQGAEKVGNILLRFFTTNRTTKRWFNG